MRVRIAVACLLSLSLLVGCSDDSTLPPKKDGPVTTVDKATGGQDKPVVSPDGTGNTLDKSAVIADKGTAVAEKGTATATLLSTTHQGWSKTDCATCHKPLPRPKHTVSRPPECALCHGANGACNPNGPKSGKKNHTQAMGCTGCHSSKHTFTATADCVACHYAAKGTSDCP